LKAPQAHSQAELGSGEFAGLGDEIEGHLESNDEDEDDPEPFQQKPRQEVPEDKKLPTSLTLDEHRQLLLQQQIEIQLRQQLQGQQMQMLQQQFPRGEQAPYKVLIAIGICIIFLLVGLIVTVVIILDGGDSEKGSTGSGILPQPSGPTPSTIDGITPTSTPSISPTATLAPVGPTSAPKTTLGRVSLRGKL